MSDRRHADLACWCVAWGLLEEGQRQHESCPVIAAAAPLRICPCDCRVCRRAWWAAGRPALRDGVLLYGTPYPRPPSIPACPPASMTRDPSGRSVSFRCEVCRALVAKVEAETPVLSAMVAARLLPRVLTLALVTHYAAAHSGTPTRSETH